MPLSESSAPLFQCADGYLFHRWRFGGYLGLVCVRCRRMPPAHWVIDGNGAPPSLAACESVCCAARPRPLVPALHRGSFPASAACGAPCAQ